jgi:hypothetical protein
MTAPDDEGHAVSYKVLARGTPVWSSDGVEIGQVREVLENEREHIFDGIVLDLTARGQRFVDAPEVARIAERRVTLAIDAAEAERLPERDAKGAPEFAADVRAGRLSRFLGGGWRRR